MAYIQKTVPAPNQIKNFGLHAFNGGLNNRSEILEDNEATDLINMMFSNDTLMEKRFGIEHYSDYQMESPITFTKEYRPYTHADVLLMGTDSKLFANKAKIADVYGRVHGENVMGNFLFVDGNVVRVFGRFPQTSGTYTRFVGNPVNELLVLDVKTPPTGFTPLDKTHTSGVTVYDYNDLSVWYEPCAHEIEDTSKGANVVPEKPKYIATHGGRVFLSGSSADDDNVFISDVSKPFYFPVTLPIQLPPNSDKVRGLAVYDDSVVVGREDDLYVIRGKTNRTDAGLEVFQLRKLNSHTGFASQDSVTVAHNYLFFLGSDGVAYALSSTNHDEKTVVTQIISRQLDLLKKPLSFDRDDFLNAVAVFHGEEWYLSINDITLIYNYRLRAWTAYENMEASSMFVYEYKVVWGDRYNRLSQFGKNYLDYGHPFRCLWKSKRFDMGDSSITKQFREFQVVAFTYPTVPSDINVMFEVDYVDVRRDMFTDSRISVFGKAKWGDRFISRDINESQPMLVGTRGRLIAFTLSNGYRPEEPIATLGELSYYPKRTHGTLVFVESEQKYYQYDSNTREWSIKENIEFNQSMKIYQVNGEFDFRHRR